jgi:hypothetical protein
LLTHEFYGDRSGRGLVGDVPEVQAEILALLVAQDLQAIPQTVERRGHVVEAHMK